MKMYKTLIAATLGMWLAAPQAQTTAPRISDGVVKIGVITDMSGTYSDFGGPTAIIAAQMAIDDFGGKVLGKPIQIISADHQNKADVGSTKAREWYDTQGVDMITESLNSSVALSISKVSAKKNGCSCRSAPQPRG